MKSAFQTCDQRRVHLIALVLEYNCNETKYQIKLSRKKYHYNKFFLSAEKYNTIFSLKSAHK